MSAGIFALLPVASASARILDLDTIFDRTPIVMNPEVKARDKEIQSTKIIGIPDTVSSEVKQKAIRLVENFYYDQFRNFQDPRVPYFMFMSKNADLAMGVGGVVRMRGWFDWGGSVPVNGFSPYFIPIPKNPLSERRLGATPSGTAIYLSILAKKDWLGSLKAYIEANFNGYDGVGFKLKKAYATVNDVTIGYAESTFSDPASQAPTIDGAGSNGKVSRTNVLVRYLHTFKDRWSVAGSFEFPKSSVSVDDKFTAKCSDYVPDIAAMGQYQWEGGMSHVRLAGLYRLLTYRDIAAAKNHNVSAWALMLSAKAQVINPLTLYASVSIGEGHSSYQSEFAAMPVDLVPEKDNPARLFAPFAYGITAGVKYNFLYNLYACLSLGRMEYRPKNHIDDSQYKSGMYGALNLFWDMSPRLQVGVEYLIGERRNFNGEHASANRVDALFQFSF